MKRYVIPKGIEVFRRTRKDVNALESKWESIWSVRKVVYTSHDRRDHTVHENHDFYFFKLPRHETEYEEVAVRRHEITVLDK